MIWLLWALLIEAAPLLNFHKLFFFDACPFALLIMLFNFGLEGSFELGGELASFPDPHEAIVPIFDHVFRPSVVHALGDLGPLLAVLVDEIE